MTSHISLACLLLQPVRCADSIIMPSLDDGSYSGADTTATVAGWGRTSEGGSTSDVLRSVDLKLLTNAQCATCETCLPGYGYAPDLVDSMICAIGDLDGGEDACYGDGGGPLFVQQARAPAAPPSRRAARAFAVTPPPSPHSNPRPSPRLGREGWTSLSALYRGATAARIRGLQASTRASPLTKPG